MNTPILHCFTNGHTTIVAENLEQAKEKWDKLTFFEPEGLDQDEIEDEHDIYQIQDNAMLVIYCEDELKHKPKDVSIDGCVWKAAAKYWAKSQGIGFLCGEDY